jgi:hypothetical protein
MVNTPGQAHHDAMLFFDCAICFAVASLILVGAFGLLAVLRKQRS